MAGKPNRRPRTSKPAVGLYRVLGSLSTANESNRAAPEGFSKNSRYRSSKCLFFGASRINSPQPARLKRLRITAPQLIALLLDGMRREVERQIYTVCGAALAPRGPAARVWPHRGDGLRVVSRVSRHANGKTEDGLAG